MSIRRSLEPALRAALVCLAALCAAPSYAAGEVVGHTISAVFDEHGVLWRAIPRKGHLEIDFSDDLGASFSPPLRVNAKRQKIRALPEDRPQIIVHGGGVHVMYSADARQAWTTYYSASQDRGRTFTAPRAVSEFADTLRHHQNKLLLQEDGSVLALWIEERPGHAGQTPDAALIARNMQIAADPRVANRVVARGLCECCRVAADRDRAGDVVALARFKYPGHVRDHGIVQWLPGDPGASVRRVTHDDWKINACMEHGPALSINDRGVAHAVWFTHGQARQGLFYARAGDVGAPSFSAPLPVGDRSGRAGHADVHATGDRVALAWKELRDGSSQVRFMQSPDEGGTWSRPRMLAESKGPSDYPFILETGGRLFVSWYAAERGYLLIPVD